MADKLGQLMWVPTMMQSPSVSASPFCSSQAQPLFQQQVLMAQLMASQGVLGINPALYAAMSAGISPHAVSAAPTFVNPAMVVPGQLGGLGIAGQMAQASTSPPQVSPVASTYLQAQKIPALQEQQRPIKLKKKVTKAKPARVYECEICHKRFQWSGNMSRHKRVHSGVKPYKCRHCGLCFNNSSNRNKHQNNRTCIRNGKASRYRSSPTGAAGDSAVAEPPSSPTSSVGTSRAISSDDKDVPAEKENQTPVEDVQPGSPSDASGLHAMVEAANVLSSGAKQASSPQQAVTPSSFKNVQRGC